MSIHNQQGAATPQTADELLDLILRNMPQLWSAQQRAQSRTLRTILNAVERMRQHHGCQPLAGREPRQ